MMYRTGIGYDIHRMQIGRPLVLGGIPIPSEKGPLAHSDGDVLLHALCDALLGAIGCGDIGEHFPDTDPQYKNIASTRLLERVYCLVKGKGFLVVHVDTVIILEKPKIVLYKQKMRACIAQILDIKEEAVNIKATTAEGVSVHKDADAVSAYAVVTILSLEKN